MNMFSCNDANVLDDSIKLLRMADVCPNRQLRQSQLAFSLRMKEAPPCLFKMKIKSGDVSPTINNTTLEKSAPPFHVADPISNKNIPNIYSESISKNALNDQENVFISPVMNCHFSSKKQPIKKTRILYNIHPNEHKYLLDS